MSRGERTTIFYVQKFSIDPIVTVLIEVSVTGMPDQLVSTAGAATATCKPYGFMHPLLFSYVMIHMYKSETCGNPKSILNVGLHKECYFNTCGTYFTSFPSQVIFWQASNSVIRNRFLSDRPDGARWDAVVGSRGLPAPCSQQQT